MQNLTATELKVLNQLSMLRNQSVLLGGLVDNVVKSLKTIGTPVNAVNASMVLTLAGVVIDGEKVTLNNPLIVGSDVYEFLSDEAQSKTTPTNIAVDITDYATKANVVLTLAAQPTSGDTMTLGAKVYTFVPDGTANANGEISIGTDLATAKLALVAAINGTDGWNVAHALVSASAFAGNDTTITALHGGTAGNAIVSTETFAAGTNVFDSVAFDGGTNCSAANAIIALVAAIVASDTQGVGAADGVGDTINLTADVAGVVGNNITIAETLANGSFAGGATNLAGGVNGTVGSVHTFMMDSGYLYITVAENTTAGKNWRRISIDVDAAY